MIFIVLELYFLPRQYPMHKPAIIGMGVLMAVYLGWIFCIKANTDRWVYPILTVLNWPQRIGFFAFTVCIPLFLLFVGEKINALRWGAAASSWQKSHISKKKK